MEYFIKLLQPHPLLPPDHPTRPFTSLIYKQQYKQLICIILLVLGERKKKPTV